MSSEGHRKALGYSHEEHRREAQRAGKQMARKAAKKKDNMMGKFVQINLTMKDAGDTEGRGRILGCILWTGRAITQVEDTRQSR